MSETTATVAPALPIPAPRTPAPTTFAGPDRFVFPLARHIQAVVDQDVHPATHAPIHPDATAMCGNCAHCIPRTLHDGQDRTRCELAVSRRGGPDVLPIFPACIQYTPRTERQDL